MELLAIVQAEAEADRLLQDAKDRKEAAIKRALEERKFKLSNLKAPAVHEPVLHELKPNLEQIKRAAQKNKAKAVRKILEELYAA